MVVMQFSLMLNILAQREGEAKFLHENEVTFHITTNVVIFMVMRLIKWSLSLERMKR